jgi:hypothetical protein
MLRNSARKESKEESKEESYQVNSILIQKSAKNDQFIKEA